MFVRGKFSKSSLFDFFLDRNSLWLCERNWITASYLCVCILLAQDFTLGHLNCFQFAFERTVRLRDNWLNLLQVLLPNSANIHRQLTPQVWNNRLAAIQVVANLKSVCWDFTHLHLNVRHRVLLLVLVEQTFKLGFLMGLWILSWEDRAILTQRAGCGIFRLCRVILCIIYLVQDRLENVG